LEIGCFRELLTTAHRSGRSAGIIRWTRAGREIASIGYTFVWRDGEPLVVLSYRANGEQIRDPIRLISTPMPGGAVRWWFQCPRCTRRVRVLYNPDTVYWRCRWCYDVTYQSSCDSDKRLSYDRIVGGALLEALSEPTPIPGPDASARELARALRSADGLILAIKALTRLHQWEERHYRRWLREQRKGRPGRPRKW
jgi:hypothetical protein